MESGQEKWHVGKTIDVGHILTTVCLVVAVGFFLNDFDDRVDKLEYKTEIVEKQLDKDRTTVTRLFDQIREDLAYIRDRLDRKDK